MLDFYTEENLKLNKSKTDIKVIDNASPTRFN